MNINYFLNIMLEKISYAELNTYLLNKKVNSVMERP